MSEESVKQFLRYPSAPLVEFALTLDNLTWQEEEVIRLCGLRGMTQEVAAERMDRSVDSVQKWYRSAILKLSVAWSNCEWIHKILE